MTMRVHPKKSKLMHLGEAAEVGRGGSQQADRKCSHHQLPEGTLASLFSKLSSLDMLRVQAGSKRRSRYRGMDLLRVAVPRKSMPQNGMPLVNPADIQPNGRPAWWGPSHSQASPKAYLFSAYGTYSCSSHNRWQELDSWVWL